MTRRSIAIYSIAPPVGLASFVAPLFATHLVTGHESWLELYALSVEKASGPTFFLLFVAGLIAGGADHAVRALGFGVLTIVLLPVAAVIQMAGDPTSHNLWPIEFVINLVVSLVPACGVLLGRYIGPILFWPSDGKDKTRWPAPAPRSAYPGSNWSIRRVAPKIRERLGRRQPPGAVR